MIAETCALVVAVAALLTFFIACQKNLNVGWYVLAALVAPIGALAALAYDPARIHRVERFRGAP